MAITLGTRGAAYVAGPGMQPDPRSWPETRRRLGATGTSRSAQAPVEGEPKRGDPPVAETSGRYLFRAAAGQGWVGERPC